MRSLSMRLSRLEGRHFSQVPITLLMPDGRTETLRGGGDYLGDLVSRAVYGDRTPDVELLARSVSSTEPGGGRMLELARAILNSPAEMK